MRIMTVRNPWAWAIVHGGKDVENRVRNIVGSYRGPVAVHVAVANARFGVGETPQHEKPLGDMMRAHRDIVADGEVWPWYENRGSIIGVVDVVGSHLCSGGCSAWAQTPIIEPNADRRDLWHIELANPRALSQPFAFKGALGVRRLDDETIARIEAAIA